MSNVLQTHPYIVLHVPKPKDFQPSMYHELGFFGGTYPKTNVGTCVKATLLSKTIMTWKGKLKSIPMGPNSGATNWSREKGGCA